MSILELKGGLHDLIAQATDNNRLARLYEAYHTIFSKEEENDWWDELPFEQQQKLEVAIVESYDEANLIDHEDMKIKHAKWLKR